MLCVVCYRDLPDIRDLIGIKYVQCVCGVRYDTHMILEWNANPDMRRRWKQVLRRDGWNVEYDRETGEVVVTNG